MCPNDCKKKKKKKKKKKHTHTHTQHSLMCTGNLKNNLKTNSFVELFLFI